MTKGNKRDLTFVALLAAAMLGFICAALRFQWFDHAFEFAMAVFGLIFVSVVSFAIVVTALNHEIKPPKQHPNVHGDARPASEAEAEAAARRDIKPAPHHDRTFPD